MKKTFVGDIHGEFSFIEEVCRNHELVIQLGDFGLGFPEIRDLSTGKPFRKDPDKLPDNLYFIRGNHDNPLVCRSYTNYLGDYGYNDKLGVFFISGAYSIDKDGRIPGRSWWPDEELSYIQLQKTIDLYKKIKPRIVIAHTAPKEAIMQFDPPMRKQLKFGGRTERAMDFMWQNHHPDIWLFGHWHSDWNKVILGTRFICLNIKQIFTLS